MTTSMTTEHRSVTLNLVSVQLSIIDNPPHLIDLLLYHPVHFSVNIFMQADNYSVPSLPTDQPPQYEENPERPTPLPAIDLASGLSNFSAMRISDPVPQGMGNMPLTSDPVPRAASSMSMQSMQSQQLMPHLPRHANTLPSPPNHARPHPHPGDRPYPEGASVYSRDSRNSQQNGPYDGYEADQASVYSSEDQTSGYRSPDSIGSQYPAHVYPQHAQQSWQAPLHGDYNPLYAAASNVLGMGPPPGPPPSVPHPPADGAGYSVSQTSFASRQPSLSSNRSAPYPGPPGPNSYHQGTSSSPFSSQNSSILLAHDTREIEPRPSMQRSGTSVALTTQKTKAVDLSAPPYTKEYIDQYRQRIKADPDPEAHFLYAKYLIDAAKKIRTTSKDQRSAKKYSEVLVGESLKVIRRLATQGEAYDEAQFFLANCYGTGTLGLQVDHERAYHLYLQAAKQNHAAASYRVAVCNEIGAGTRREAPRAAAFYRKAASLGDTPAMYKLGMILLQGSLGEQKNPREATNWLKRAAEQADEENPHALHELGLLHELPNSQLVPHDPVYAKNLFTQAAHLGYTQSQYKLGQCYEYGSLNCPVDPRRSIAWYTKAAEKGDAEAELALSGWYLTGSEGVLKQSDSEAYLWARRAANKGLSKAEYAVGYYAEVGIGIKQDIEFAKRWYMRAAGMSFVLFIAVMFFLLNNLFVMKPRATPVL